MNADTRRFFGRRRVLAYLASALASRSGYAQTIQSQRTEFAKVIAGYRFRFPWDEGSHPAFRVEWWYVTGWVEAPARAPMGFQVTFFRARPQIDERNPSAFTPRQIMIAHAALSDESRGRLAHDQRVARAAFGLGGADEGRTRAWIDDWSLTQDGASYHARIAAADFGLDLAFTQTQPPLLQGDEGVSRKGPRADSASYYYSVPQLKVTGMITEPRKRYAVSGSAWLDHEWSSSYMDERAVGWDWIGINFDDGGALMVFRMRDRAGAKLWAGGTYRSADGVRRTFKPEEIEVKPLRIWQSARTGASYPVAWAIRVAALELAVVPLMDDQESDTRASTGAVYWEGAVRAMRDNKPIGRGYLELTGYLQPLKL
ncbi:MAG TPA: carotenoid 1,2-hydratase [Burkholderiales bacterium]|nr:carotenoid 1,2-hydratase [Burkholderiales bacterium]